VRSLESLLAPTLTPTMPPAPARAASRDSAAPHLAVEAEPVDHGLVGLEPEQRGRGLPGCGSGVTVPISTKPKPRPSSASGTSACLSKPGAIPIGLGN
jgi:hypothetical protein